MKNKIKLESVMDMIKLENPSIILLQETKLEVDEALNKCKKIGNFVKGK